MTSVNSQSTGSPRVSVVIPTYNHCELLKEALTSLIQQTHTDWEAIVVNNFSDDGTVDMVRGFSDLRIKLVNFRNHGVIAASRNKGIELARGEWIAFLDSDDLWLPDKLQRVLSDDANDFDIISHRETTFSAHGDLTTSPHYKPMDAEYRALLFKGTCFSPSAALVKRSLLNEIKGFREDPDYVTVEDYDLWLRLMMAGAKVKFVDAVLSKYRLHENNASGSILKHMRAGLKAIDDHFRALQPKRRLDGVRLHKRRAMIIYGAGRSFHWANKLQEARAQYLLSIRAYPLYLRALVALISTFIPLRNRTH